MAMIQSAFGPLTIAPARADELTIVMEILDQAARWLLAKGVEQWSSPPPPEFCSFMAHEIEKGEVYLARTQADEYPLATLRFGWSDQALWGDHSDCAGYVCTLATRPSIHGRGIGVTLLDWAKAHVKSRQRPYLRLDCMASNLVLQRYYERLGFRFCGYATSETHQFALYEIKL